MKRCLMLFMTTALLVFSLAACGCSAQQAGTDTDSQNGGSSQNDTGNQNDSAVLDSDNGSTNNGSANSGTGSTDQTPNDPLYDEDGNIIDDTLDGISDAVDDVGDAVTGNDMHEITGGVSYEQMLRNGRIHDRDGNLKDGENASV